MSDDDMAEAERAAHALAMIEYDWIYTVGRDGKRLHHARYVRDPAAWYDVPRGYAITTCGQRGEFAIPGFMSRLGLERCAHCCDVLGIARGVGSPKNDEALRAWVARRLAA